MTQWFAFCLCRGRSCRSLLLNALSLGESLNRQKWLLLLPGTFLGDITAVFLGGYADSEAMSLRWAEQGLAWPPAAYRGLRSRESCPRTQRALLWASMPHGCFCGVSAFFFFSYFQQGSSEQTHTCVNFSFNEASIGSVSLTSAWNVMRSAPLFATN